MSPSPLPTLPMFFKLLFQFQIPPSLHYNFLCLYSRDQQIYAVNVRIVNILGFAGHMVVTTTQLHCGSLKALLDTPHISGCGCVSVKLSWSKVQNLQVILNLSHTLISSKLNCGLRTHKTTEISAEGTIDICQPCNFTDKETVTQAN